MTMNLFYLKQKATKVPVRKVAGGYKWGNTGKVYKTKAAAEKQGRAIRAAGYAKGGDTINAAGNYCLSRIIGTKVPTNAAIIITPIIEPAMVRLMNKS